jgi:hypothetical protein
LKTRKSLRKKNGRNKKYADNSLQRCQRSVGGQGRSQRRNVADSVALKTARPLHKYWTKLKASIQTPYFSIFSVVFVAKAAPSADMSLIWLPSRLDSCCINNGRTKANI